MAREVHGRVQLRMHSQGYSSTHGGTRGTHAVEEVAREVHGRVQLRMLEEHPELDDHHEADVAQQRRQVP